MLNLSDFNQYIQAVDSAQSNADKGKTLEALSRYLFDCFEGIAVIDHNVNTGSEEIDIILWNEKLESIFSPWDSVILVECKNWSNPVGAAILSPFITKIRNRHLKTGIFIAANGVTGDFLNGNNVNEGAVQLLHDTLTRDGIRIVVIRMEDLKSITSLDDLRTIIKERYCKLYMKKVF